MTTFIECKSQTPKKAKDDLHGADKVKSAMDNRGGNFPDLVNVLQNLVLANKPAVVLEFK